ncbi:MAG: hypothetical protein RBS14_00095 [Atribacterota bacterium]|jgi:hypothetical protein|nr:hypothetical protein [Atribacterota bacterium]
MTDKNNFPILRKQDSALALKKTKNLMALVDRVLTTQPNALAIQEDESWMERLWEWADKHDIWDMSLPRTKIPLTQLTELSIGDKQMTTLPPEIGQLTQLTM